MPDEVICQDLQLKECWKQLSPSSLQKHRQEIFFNKLGKMLHKSQRLQRHTGTEGRTLPQEMPATLRARDSLGHESPKQ